MSRTYLTKQELCNAIYETVRNAAKPMTRLEIARAIGHKKSPHINSMIEDLTLSGFFIRGDSATKFGLPVLTYEIAHKEEEPICDEVYDGNEVLEEDELRERSLSRNEYQRLTNSQRRR